MVAKGHSQDENQVSRTSSSWSQFSGSAGGSISTWTRSGSFLWYQTGILWPHHNWRLLHQSVIFSIQCSNVLIQRSGRKRVCELETASIVSLMRGYLRNHCSLN